MHDAGDMGEQNAHPVPAFTELEPQGCPARSGGGAIVQPVQDIPQSDWATRTDHSAPALRWGRQQLQQRRSGPWKGPQVVLPFKRYMQPLAFLSASSLTQPSLAFTFSMSRGTFLLCAGHTMLNKNEKQDTDQPSAFLVCPVEPSDS